MKQPLFSFFSENTRIYFCVTKQKSTPFVPCLFQYSDAAITNCNGSLATNDFRN